MKQDEKERSHPLSPKERQNPFILILDSSQRPLSGVANGLHEADGSISWVVQVLVRLPQFRESEPLKMAMLMPNDPLAHVRMVRLQVNVLKP